MALPHILYPPPDEQGWQTWAFWHLQHHEALISATSALKEVSLGLNTPLWPVDLKDKKQREVWSRAHQDAHDVLGRILGCPSIDVTGFDPDNKRGLDGWAFEHFQLHQSAAALCGMPV